MRVLGMISGTSHDGIDIAVVDFTLDGGSLRGSVEHTTSVPYAPTLRERLRSALPPAAATFAEFCELDTLIGQAFADAAASVASRVEGIDLVCSHGQTVYHWVDGRRALGTLQIGQPAWIAERLGVPVVSDIRIRDIVVGGQGAPLVSFMDELLLAGVGGRSAALNLGGIANMTVVGAGAVPVAYDIGPANALIDAAIVAAGANTVGFDVDGEVAASGRVDETLLEVLLAEPYYLLDPPKSTGKELFHPGYVDDAIARSGVAIGTADLVATLTELTVRTVARDVLAREIRTLAVSGGGCRNPVIMAGLRSALTGVNVVLSDEFGAPADDKEAIAFALIGWCTAHGLPATTPSATGASVARILGTITPGRGPLVLPQPVLSPPTALTLTTPEGTGS
jgi:anhydro-N-acetylmuramic acid kinase